VTDRRQLAVLAGGHACADFCQGAVPALVPFLVYRGGMDFKATGVLVLVMSIASSLLQPLIGARADRYGYELVLTVALGLTLPAVALIELSPSPGLAFPAAALAGMAVVAGYTSTVVLGQRMLPRRETFAAGMTLGFAMGAGGLTVALLGPVADSAGPEAALWISGGLAALAVPAALKIGGNRLLARRRSARAVV
jgi:FSR family fosmidomycin resistance protein-like MFS transporter